MFGFDKLLVHNEKPGSFRMFGDHPLVSDPYRRPRPLPRGKPLPLGALPAPLPALVGIPPLIAGMLDLLVMLVAAVPGVTGPRNVFRLGVAFRLAKLASPVPKVVSSPPRLVPPFAPASRVDVSRPSFWRCCCCHRLIESLRGAYTEA